MSDEAIAKAMTKRDAAIADLKDLERQIDAGEVDDTSAARLRSRYEVEIADALVTVDAIVAGDNRDRSKRRTWFGVGLFIAVAGVAVFAVTQAIEPRPDGGFATGGVASDVVADGPVDLADITNEEMEAVIAANPDIPGMRLALGRRYVEEGDFSAALPHYLYVLERDENPEALMYLGWMTYLSGDPATGAALLERSLTADQGNELAAWFLANALFHGVGDRAGAVPLLEQVIASESAPPDIIAEAQRMLAEEAP